MGTTITAHCPRTCSGLLQNKRRAHIVICLYWQWQGFYSVHLTPDVSCRLCDILCRDSAWHGQIYIMKIPPNMLKQSSSARLSGLVMVSLRMKKSWIIAPGALVSTIWYRWSKGAICPRYAGVTQTLAGPIHQTPKSAIDPFVAKLRRILVELVGIL